MIPTIIEPGKKVYENMVDKEDDAGNQHFLHFL